MQPYSNVLVELKTKSTNIKSLENIREPSKVIIGFSMNTERMISMHEKGTALLNERIEAAARCEEMGFYVSFSGIITFKNAAELREVVKQVPMQKLLIETDSPYLAPVPYRGKSNQPRYVSQVAECVAELKGLSVEAVAEQTKENFYCCFPLAISE